MANLTWQFLPGINTFSGDIGIALGALNGGSTPSSGAWPAANDALFVPVVNKQTVLIKRLYAINGGTVSGNIDVALLSKGPRLLRSAGSTAQSGTNAPQFFDVTDIVIGPGIYYLSVALDNTTGTLFRGNISLRYLQAIGMAKQASGFAIPSAPTLATVTANYLPLIGAEIAEIQ
jgi:hypothetical protein